MYSHLLQQRSGIRLSDSLGIPSPTRKVKIYVAAAIASLSLGATLHAQAADDSVNKSNASQAEANEPAALDSVVVTSRKREELAQDVPIPETIISGKTLERDNAVTINDIAQKTPGLMVSATNARQTSIALRGLGKNSANEAIQGSVGIIIDNVVLSQAGMSYSNFIDVEQVELLRGPQGTLQGKNTTLGALNITTKRPSFTPQYTIEAGYGSRNTFDGKASATGPLVDGLLAYRASIYATEGDGQIENIYTPLGNSWQGPRRYGGRAQLLLTPSDTLNARLITSFDSSGERTNLSPFIADPTTFANGAARSGTANGTSSTYSSRLARAEFNGYKPLIGDVTRSQVDLNSAQTLPVNQAAISLEVNKNIGEYTLTSVSAYRHNDFDFRNDFDYTHFDIQTLSGTVGQTNQFTQELRLASPLGQSVDYQVGLFGSKSQSYTLSRTLYGQDAGAFYASNTQYNQTTVAARQASLNGVFLGTAQNPNAESIAAFGQANWHVNDKATLTVGLRETVETVGNFYNKYSTGGVAVTGQAAAIRTAQQGVLYGIKTPDDQSNSSLSWLINPSYKLSNDVLLYASAGKGIKSGAVQLDSVGNLANVNPEKSLDFELGIKSTWLNRQLFLNANLYRTDISDYQTTATVAVPTTVNSSGFTTQLVNIGGVLLRGLEVDGGWSPTNRWNFNFGAAFNDAIYSDYKNGTYASELNKNGFADYTGRQLANAPKVTLNFGVDYKQPVSDNLIGHVFLNNVYRSKTNLSSTFSQYTEQSAYSVTNGGLGVVTQNGKYEFNVVAKNLFDTKYAVNKGQYTNSAGVAEFWGDARYVGALFRAKF
ncbi:MAG TPA: TonB-dependent receptor [Methylophilaceae bacterium]|jgi:iron complex outermembrane receptor protein